MDDTASTGTHRMIEANGLRMSVHEAGSGTPVLLLHGFPQGSRAWARVAADLARDARVIVPDLRGAGQTEPPADGYDSATIGADIVALMDALAIERAAIVAHDWSALACFDLCLAHPDRVTDYVAIAVPAPYIRMTPKLAGAMMRAMPHLWFQWAIATPGLGPRLLSRGRQRLAHWLLRAFEVRPMPDADVEAYVTALRDPARARAASRLYRGLILPGFLRIMRGAYRGRVLRTRTLVLFGAEDGLIPRDALSVPAEDAPETTIEFLPGGGHFLLDDAPDAVAVRLREFLRLPQR